MRLKGIILIICLAVAGAVAAASGAGTAHAGKVHRYAYTLVDLGTFGGPQAGQSAPPYITASGLIGGTADTGVTDPYGANENGNFNGDPFVQHAYVWRNGVLADVGSLGTQSANGSYPNAINAQGDEAGISVNGTTNPLTGQTEGVPVLWQHGHIINLGTFGGNEGQAFALNNHDQVVGGAEYPITDPFSMMAGEQSHAFLWQNGHMRDLGTLGGPDSGAGQINDAGQVAGSSYTNSTPNPATGIPTQDPFLWQNGHMRDLGTLGGTIGSTASMNSRGEVVGQSDLAGDQAAHPFLWNGTHMIDLGTLGGDYANPNGINDNGAVQGISDLADGTHHGFLWTNGTMHDLPPLAGHACSNAFGMNNLNAVVGNATNCHGGQLAAVIWQSGQPVDLNTLVPPSSLHLTEAFSINDRGEIVGYGKVPTGDEHNFLLIPQG